MIDYIRGTLSESSPHHATLEASGIGYKLAIPVSCFGKLPQLGSACMLFVSTVIREDAHKSYGFFSKQERDFFEKLIEVSGIGPKTALALIGHMELSEMQLAIAHANVALLSKVPGIGKKTAERLVVELKDKTSKIAEAAISAPTGKKDLFSDALSALVNLGYQPLQAQKAVREALTADETPSDLASVITTALRNF
jgi:Holliday junction DNA helicase RuvA